MPRDAVTVTPLNLNATSAWDATTISVANGASIATTKGTKMLVRVTNTNGTARVVTFAAGDSTISNGAGDLAESITATTGDELFVLDSARFLQTDGNINVDFAASFAGSIYALQLPG